MKKINELSSCPGSDNISIAFEFATKMLINNYISQIQFLLPDYRIDTIIFSGSKYFNHLQCNELCGDKNEVNKSMVEMNK